MARQAKIYYQDQLAGYLIEGDGGYVFKYEKQYLKLENPKPISLTLQMLTYP